MFPPLVLPPELLINPRDQPLPWDIPAQERAAHEGVYLLPKGFVSIDRFNAAGEFIERRATKNIATNLLQILIATFFQTTAVSGASYMEFGSGNPAWDAGAAPLPQATDTELYWYTNAGTGLRKATSGNTYLDIHGVETGTPTNVVRVKAAIAGGDTAFTIREVGIFGGAASITLGTGSMTNEARIQALIHNNGDTLNANYDVTFIVSNIPVGSL